jgi:hypothetical protein
VSCVQIAFVDQRTHVLKRRKFHRIARWIEEARRGWFACDVVADLMSETASVPPIVEKLSHVWEGFAANVRLIEHSRQAAPTKFLFFARVSDSAKRYGATTMPHCVIK